MATQDSTATPSPDNDGFFRKTSLNVICEIYDIAAIADASRALIEEEVEMSSAVNVSRNLRLIFKKLNELADYVDGSLVHQEGAIHG